MWTRLDACIDPGDKSSLPSRRVEVFVEEDGVDLAIDGMSPHVIRCKVHYTDGKPELRVMLFTNEGNGRCSSELKFSIPLDIPQESPCEQPASGTE